MSYKNEMQTMRDVLLNEKGPDLRKLDMLVRQGMMSPAQLPMLHRGLDKLNSGKSLSPTEREAVNKVVNELLFIVTGDDTVFQKARQHTQKTRYQTEEVAEEVEEVSEALPPHLQKIIGKDGNIDPKKVSKHVYDGKKTTSGAKVTDVTPKGYGPKEEVEIEEKMDMAKADMGDVIKDFRKSDAPQFKGKSEKKKREMAIAAKLGAEREEGMREESENVEEGAFKSMVTKDQENKRLGKTTMIANPKTQKVRKVTPSRAKMAVKKGFVYAEEWTDEELDSLFEMEYKDKFQAMLKKTGKSLDKMSDEEKKKFFNTVDAAHKAKNEAYDTPAVKKPVSQMTPSEKKKNDERRSAYNTFQKRQRDNEKAVKDMKGMAPHMKNPALGEEVDIEEGARADAMRAMRSDKKGMASVKKDGGTKSYKGPEAGEEKHGGHIVMQLRKAISVNKPVKFKDGTTHQVSKAHAHKFLSKYNAGKPQEKENMHGAHSSHADFMKHVS